MRNRYIEQGSTLEQISQFLMKIVSQQNLEDNEEE